MTSEDTGMALMRDQALARVGSDLAKGHTFLAGQRLASLVVAHPHDLEIRAWRGSVYHQIGNFPEAGRWGYLAEDLDPIALAAFEKAFTSPWDQLNALKLRTDPSGRLGPLAEARLGELVRRAGEQMSGQVTWTDAGPAAGPTGGRWEGAAAVGCVGLVILAILALFGLALYGLYMLMR